MARKPKPSGDHHKGPDLSTGNKAIAYAEKHGAIVTANGSGPFTSVETTKGKVNIRPGDLKESSVNIARTKKWFKLLGLLSLIGVPAGIWFFQNFHIIW